MLFDGHSKTRDGGFNGRLGHGDVALLSLQETAEEVGFNVKVNFCSFSFHLLPLDDALHQYEHTDNNDVAIVAIV